MPRLSIKKSASCLNNPFLLVLILLTIILRIPSLFEPYWYGDEGIYLTLGQAINKGLLLYRDIHDNKPPVLYLLAALAGNVAWFRELLLVWSIFTLSAFSVLVKKLFPKNNRLYYLTLSLFAIGYTLPWLEGNIANAEVFMLLPTFLAILLAFPEKKQELNFLTLGKFLLSGLLFSVSFHLKAPGLFDLAALGLLTVFYLTKKDFFNQFIKLLVLMAGFLLPMIVFSIYFAQNGALAYYLQAALLQNFTYLGSWRAGGMNQGDLGQNSALMVRAVGLVASSLLLFIFKKYFNKQTLFVLLWFLFAFFAALLSERPYAHYLIQLLPPTVLLIGLFFYQSNKKTKWVIVALLLFLVSNLKSISFWYYPVPDYYRNFINFTTGQVSREQYFDWFDKKVSSTYTLANYLVKRTASNDRVFIWSDASFAYALSKRLPPGRFTTAYHIADFNGWQETIKAIETVKPGFIVIDLNEKRPFPQLSDHLKQHCRLEKELPNYLIFRCHSSF